MSINNINSNNMISFKPWNLLYCFKLCLKDQYINLNTYRSYIGTFTPCFTNELEDTRPSTFNKHDNLSCPNPGVIIAAKKQTNNVINFIVKSCE